jgi:hypothetical protein
MEAKKHKQTKEKLKFFTQRPKRPDGNSGRPDGFIGNEVPCEGRPDGNSGRPDGLCSVMLKHPAMDT